MAAGRGIRFVPGAAPGDSGTLLYPHPDDQRDGRLLDILLEVALAFGFKTRSDYLRALGQEGPEILRRLIQNWRREERTP